MNKFTFLLQVIFLGFITLFLTSCGDDDETISSPESSTIVDIAAGDPQFSTLVAALNRVDLVSVLEGVGPFTVFAPTNAAFQSLGVELSTISDEELTEILLYHVLNGAVESSAIANGQSYVSSVASTGPNGARLSILIEKDSGIELNGLANVITADVKAINGVIHVVDRVLQPLDIVGHALANDNFTSLVGALSSADGDLVSVLGSNGPFTVFAPVNDAFSAISEVAATLSTAQLSKVLTYHVISGNIRSTDLTNSMNVTTVNGENFIINLSGSSATITDAKGGVSNIVLTDVQTKNGVIHVLDTVILPANL